MFTNLLRLMITLAFIPLICGAEGKPQKQRLSVLIVDGINNHDWEAGTRAVSSILAATGRFNVEVSTTPPREAPKEAWDKWRPQFSRYDAVLVNFNGGHKDDGIRWPAEVEQSLERYVASGGGLIILHAANNAFLHWAAWNEMIGLGWRDRSFGPGLVVDDNGKAVTIPQGGGLNPGHGPRHDFQLCLARRDHPITRGLPECWLHPSEQLTHGQHGPAVGLTILTYAWSKDSKQNEPLDWVRAYGRGRIYTTMLGHTWKNEPNPNYEDVGFQTLLARGTEWAASGRVTIPAPRGFQGQPKVVHQTLQQSSR
ncbi:MAG TPA: ThuA domain-containing protein [Blastocatellia bacterium]|nr:ThuA domain-containing protein [Blastocatellia bacterium]